MSGTEPRVTASRVRKILRQELEKAQGGHLRQRSGTWDVDGSIRIHLGNPSRYAMLFAAGALIIFATRNSGAATSSAVAQHIERISNDIPPAVVIEGKPTTLSALMRKFTPVLNHYGQGARRARKA